jgi:hypothetical protein
LVESGLDVPIGQVLVELDLMPAMKAKQQEFIAQRARLLFEAVGQIDGDVGPELAGAHLFREKSALQSLIVVTTARSDNLRTEDLEGLRIELALAVHHRAQHGHTPHIAVVEYLDDFRALVAEAKIRFVEDQRAAERVEGVEDRRDRGRAAREEGLVTE